MTTPSQPVAVVTGGARRLGRHLVEHLAGKGFCLVFGYLGSAAEAGDLVARLTAEGREARAVRMDVSDKDSVAEAFSGIRSREGRVDLLVNNVGNYDTRPVRELDPEGWDAIIGANLSGAFYCAYHALRMMGAGGNIINIGMAGLEGIRASRHAGDYFVSKTGLLSLTRSLAVAWADAGIRANMISPGQLENSVDLPEGVELARQIPLGRAGALGDIAQAVDFILDAPYVTGVNLDVAGGYRL